MAHRMLSISGSPPPLSHQCTPLPMRESSQSRQCGLALLGSVPVQSGSGCKLQSLFQAEHLSAVHSCLLLQLPILPHFQDALLFTRFGGSPDKPFQVVAHSSHYKGHGEGDIRGVGPHRCPHYRPHDFAKR